MKRNYFILIFMLLFSVILSAQSAVNVDQEKEAIKNCVLDYGIGWYSGAADRMERALHPDFNKVIMVKFKPDGNTLLQYSTVSGLVEMTRGKGGLLDESKRNASVTVFDVEGNTACAVLKSAQFNDYLQLVKVDGNWKIINVLWNFGPSSAQKPVIKDFNLEVEREAIKNASTEFAEGIILADLTKFEKTAHPELNFVQLSTIASTGKQYIGKMGMSMLTELVRGKVTLVPENQRTLEVNILDGMDGYAFVKCTTPAMNIFLQMAKTGEQWNVVNTLAARKQIAQK